MQNLGACGYPATFHHYRRPEQRSFSHAVAPSRNVALAIPTGRDTEDLRPSEFRQSRHRGSGAERRGIRGARVCGSDGMIRQATTAATMSMAAAMTDADCIA